MKLCEAKDCTGCLACMNACQFGAITLELNDEGFEYPHIDVSRCVNCGVCIKSCPILMPVFRACLNEVYAVWSRDENIRYNSSSGGFFSEVARVILSQGGVVFGAAFDESFKVRHIAVETEVDLQRLRGSKYVQSYIGDAFRRVEDLLSAGRVVLFTGTPCQIAGLYAFCNKEYENLWTADLVCHGVPTPLIFQEYKAWLEECAAGARLSEFSFRDKQWSWKNFNTKAVFEGGKLQHGYSALEKNGYDATSFQLQENLCMKTSLNQSIYFGTWQEDPYMRGFLREYFLRPACHRCKFANLNRPGDITMGDFWGYRSRKGQFQDDDRGISMVMLNTEKAKSLFSLCKDRLYYTQTPLREAVRGNRALSSCFPPSPHRAAFWADFHRNGFEGTIDIYLDPEPVGFVLKILYRYGRDSIQYAVFLRMLRCLGFPRRVFVFVRDLIWGG